MHIAWQADVYAQRLLLIDCKCQLPLQSVDQPTTCMLCMLPGVEMFKKSLSEGQAGDNVGLLLRRIQRDDVVRGQVVCKPGSVTPHKKFKGEIYALTKDEGGRHTPFFSNYKPQFFFRTADITGAAQCLLLLDHVAGPWCAFA